MCRDKSSNSLREKALGFLPDQLLNDNEQVILAIKPSGWLIAFLSFRFIVAALFIATGLMLFGQVVGFGRATAWLIILTGVASVGRCLVAVCQWAARSYVLTDKWIITVEGLFTVHVFQCDLAKVQNMYLQLPMVPRLLGLGHIAITTAGTGAVGAVLSFCRQPLQVHKSITENIENLGK